MCLLDVSAYRRSVEFIGIHENLELRAYVNEPALAVFCAVGQSRSADGDPYLQKGGVFSIPIKQNKYCIRTSRLPELWRYTREYAAEGKGQH